MAAIAAGIMPARGRCEHCKQDRPLFTYEPDHNSHLGAGFLTCRWCTRDKQPLLCVRCYDAEAQLEDENPALEEEFELLERICANNRRLAERNSQ